MKEATLNSRKKKIKGFGLTLSDPGGVLFAIPLSKLIANVFWMGNSISEPDGFSS